jgi:P27 family predicted phage terminase small subunit
MPRPRKSDYDHELQGSISQAFTSAESSVEAELPKAPKSLSKDERKRFNDYVSTLAHRRAVTSGDGSLIAILVRNESRCAQAQAKLDEEGLVRTYTRLDASGEQIETEKANLHLAIVEKAERAAITMLSKLGLTPTARDHVKPTAPRKPKEELTDGYFPPKDRATPFLQDVDLSTIDEVV